MGENEKEMTTAGAGGSISSSNTETRSRKRSSGGVGSLIKLLPTGTVFLFQFLNPVVTNSGSCNTSNKYLCAVLLAGCGFSCVFSTFTDSYSTGSGDDKKRHYGIVTTKGLWPYPPKSKSIDLSGYRLRGRDFVHAVLSLLVFSLLGLLDTNTVHCFYPSFESTQKRLLQVLPPVLGAFVGGVFTLLPNLRHGIGYPVSADSTDTSKISSDTTNTTAPPPDSIP